MKIFSFLAVLAAVSCANEFNLGGVELNTQERAAEVTSKVYLDLDIDNQSVGRIVIGLFGKVVPKTVKNFESLCIGTGIGNYGKDLWYKGSRAWRNFPHYMISFGDIINNDGTSGESIYGPYFNDENFILQHDRPYLVCMNRVAEYGRDSNTSQFNIMFRDAPWMDKTEECVVFG